MQQTEDIVTKADEFVEENRELVGDAGPGTLGRIVTHGAPIAVQLSDSVTERKNLLVDVLGALETAINGQQATPKEMYKLEMLHKVRLREYERVNEAMSRFVAFMESVTELLEASKAEAGTKPEEHVWNLDKMGIFWPPEPPQKRSLWRRIFG